MAEEASQSSKKTNLLWYAFPVAVLLLIVGGYFLSMPTAHAVESEDQTPESGQAMYFYRAGCYYCELQEPIVEKLMEEGYDIAYMDVGIHPEYLSLYGIGGTPTFVASNGDKKIGLTQEDELRAWLDQHGAKSA